MRLLVATITLILTCLFAANTTFAYTVKQGDTMTEIASEHNLSIQELAEMNPQIKNLDEIYIGDTLNTEKPKKVEINKVERPVHIVNQLEADTDLLATLIRAEAHREELVQAPAEILSPDANITLEETVIASYLDYDIDYLSRFVNAEAPKVEVAEVKTEVKSVTQNENVVSIASIKEPKQQAVKLSNYEMDLLARLVRAEAQTEPFEGKVAVACVVLNRLESSLFPDTIKEVIYERGQFQPVSNGEINEPADSESIEAVKAALTEKRELASESLFFYNPTIATSRWLDTRPTTVVIGQHVFKN